ncbi:MAG TPA: hypothetical protein VH559_07855, partial [Gemmatimonadaceae bacterium]
MPEYLSPGVYLEEVDTGSKPIEGVSTSTAGMIGVTERGPVNVPILITSAGEFRRWFGDVLADADFTNVNGFHCYLPQAIGGFFTNGGKIVWVTRIIRDDATYATTALYDRGDLASVNTRLLRAAGQETGTSINPPLVSVITPSTLAVNDAIRIGDGSQAEYRTITTGPTASSHVALSFPLAHSHDTATNIADVARARLDPPFTAALTLTPGIVPGTKSITVKEGAAGEAASLAVNQVVEIGNTATDAEHRRIDRVDGTGDTRTLTLDAPLVLGYASGAAVTPLDLSGGTTTPLAAPATARDAVIFGDNLAGAFTNIAHLVA